MIIIYIIMVILAVIIIILFADRLRYKSEIKYISRQIAESKGEFTNIRMNSLNKYIENLTIRINELYQINQKTNVELQKSQKELKRGIANMSHDLRTPLTSIMGYLQLIKEKIETNEEVDKYIDIVERRTKTLENLISGLYAIARVESDEYKFNLKSVDIKNILYDTVALFYDDFINKNIEPSINVEDGTSNIITDENAISRVFSNLINNMLKYSKKTVVINLIKHEDTIDIELINDALELNDDDVEHIFERFYTSDSTRSDTNTGLGLSIVKALVEGLGGKVGAELVDGMLKIRILLTAK